MTYPLKTPCFTIDEISGFMYDLHISVRKMSKELGVNSSRLHAMFKYKDEVHNRSLMLACTKVLSDYEDKLVADSLINWEYTMLQKGENTDDGYSSDISDLRVHIS